MQVIYTESYFIAYLIARVFLGCLFFFQGYDAVVKVGIKAAADTYARAFAESGRNMSRGLINAAAVFTSYTELVCGALLLLGLFTYPALYLLGLNLIVAAIGFGLTTPLWDTRYVLPRLLLLLLLLLLPAVFNYYSLDCLFDLLPGFNLNGII